jgi:uncharacterized nucleotidyltransferase DUF6036
LARSEFDSFCQKAFGFLDRCQVRYLVIGGLAVVVVGEPRTTADADVIGYLSSQEAEALIGKAKKAGFQVDVETEKERLRMTGALRFRRRPFQLDVILASLPFEDAALSRSQPRRLFGRNLRFPTPEDLIVFKVLAGRQKDLLDAEGIARRHRGKLDRKYLEDSLRPICELAEDMTAWKRLEDVLRNSLSP